MEKNNGPIYAIAAVLCVLIITLGVVFSGVLRPAPNVTTTIAQGKNLSTVSISASGTAQGIPSMASVDVFINATGNSTSAATANFSNKLAAFNSIVYNYVGKNTSLIQTQYYSVGKPYSYRLNSTNSLYEAQESITVTLPQISKLNGFLSNITAVSGLQVQDVSATLSNSQITSLRQQALQSAIANATAQAKLIIGNATIVNTNVTVGSYFAHPYPIYAAASGTAAIAPATTPLYYNGTSSVYESIQETFYYQK